MYHRASFVGQYTFIYIYIYNSSNHGDPIRMLQMENIGQKIAQPNQAVIIIYFDYLYTI